LVIDEVMLLLVTVAVKPLAAGLLALASSLALFGYLTTKAAWRIYLVSAWRKRRRARA